ncbi:MAG: hypothetical protein II867_00635 [Clostridia bacterium]|nr:hypothetical protein [Clostridia bacterium]
MKKKGLIISTIVMVVVLIASLSTATYAWFSASSSTTVDALTLQVNSASAVAIGAHATGDGSSQDHYLYDAVTLGYNSTAGSENTPTYTGDNVGLGTSLAFSGGNGTLTLSKAVGTAASITAGTSVTTPDATFNPAHVVYAASSGTTDGVQDDTVIDNESIAYARANTDYVVLKMGAQAAQDGVYGIYATIKVSTTDTATTLKMMAAMHFYIKVGATSKEFDLFGNGTNNTAKSSVASLTAPTGTGVIYAVESTQATATFSFLIAGVGAYTGSPEKLATDGSAITQFEIYAYIAGNDPHCVSKATGSGAKFEIEFNAIKQADTSAPVTYLTLA